MSLEDNKKDVKYLYLKKGSRYEHLIHLANKNSLYRCPQKYHCKLKLPPIATSNKKERAEERIHKIKEKIYNLHNVNSPKDDNTDYDDTSCVDTERSNDTSAAIYIDNILSLEDRLVENSLKLQEIKTVRLKEQNDICKEIQSLDNCPFEKRSSQRFLNLCKYKKDNTKKPKLTIKIKKPEILFKKSHDNSKNIQLSEKTSMDSRMTDEEKSRMQFLLADINEDEQLVPEISEINSENAFTLSEDEKNRLNEIHDKLLKFDETNDKRDRKLENKSYEQINWKEIKELSIKEIDKAIKTIHKEDKIGNTDKHDKKRDKTPEKTV